VGTAMSKSGLGRVKTLWLEDVRIGRFSDRFSGFGNARTAATSARHPATALVAKACSDETGTLTIRRDARAVQAASEFSVNRMLQSFERP
jgi:hypothetical protein